MQLRGKCPMRTVSHGLEVWTRFLTHGSGHIVTSLPQSCFQDNTAGFSFHSPCLWCEKQHVDQGWGFI